MPAKRFDRFRETIASLVAGVNIRPSTILAAGRISTPIGAMPRTWTFEKDLPSERGTLMSVKSSGDTYGFPVALLSMPERAWIWSA